MKWTRSRTRPREIWFYFFFALTSTPDCYHSITQILFAAMPQQPRNILDAFARKKAEIVKKIAEPIYTDRSPQGYIDLGIRDLIDDINSQHGLVTTSSCAGRVSVFVEGRKKLEVRPRADDSALSLKDEEHQSEESHLPDDLEVSVSFASTGGKGASGKWLWVSHEPIVEPTHQENIYFSTLFGLSTEVTGSKQPAPKDVRYVHFKFEPMVRFFISLAKLD